MFEVQPPHLRGQALQAAWEDKTLRWRTIRGCSKRLGEAYRLGWWNMIHYLAYAVLGVCVFLWGLRWFERANLYFPTSRLDGTPELLSLPFDSLTIESLTGERIHGWLVPSESSRGVLVFCHGNAGNISHRLESIQMFHEMDLTVAIFDYPGYGLSTGRPTESGFYLAAESFYEKVRELWPGERYVIFGRSLGGAVAVDLASRTPSDGLIVESCFTNTVDMGRELFPFLPVKCLVTQPFDSLAKISNVSVPKLFVHSREDDIVPYRLGRRLFESANEPKTFLEISGGHNEGFIESGSVYTEGLNGFLDVCLPRESPTRTVEDSDETIP